MQELILMRHAAALPVAIDGSDFERPLSAPGRAAALQAARRLAANCAGIERVLFSPARRTRETAAIVAQELALDTALLHAVPELYAATPRAIRAAIVRDHANAAVLLIVGHNPGLSEFGSQLISRRSRDHLPTAGFWRLPFDASGWQALTRSAGATAHTG